MLDQYKAIILGYYLQKMQRNFLVSPLEKAKKSREKISLLVGFFPISFSPSIFATTYKFADLVFEYWHFSAGIHPLHRQVNLHHQTQQPFGINNHKQLWKQSKSKLFHISWFNLFMKYKHVSDHELRAEKQFFLISQIMPVSLSVS